MHKVIRILYSRRIQIRTTVAVVVLYRYSCAVVLVRVRLHKDGLGYME